MIVEIEQCLHTGRNPGKGPPFMNGNTSTQPAPSPSRADECYSRFPSLGGSPNLEAPGSLLQDYWGDDSQIKGMKGMNGA